MALQYGKRVQQLYEALQDEEEEKRIEAADILRSLVDKIVLRPVDGKVEIDAQGDLAGILTIASERKNLRTGSYGGFAIIIGCGGTQLPIPTFVGDCDLARFNRE